MTTTHRITTAAALVLSVAATGAPTATARLDDGNPTTTANRAPATVYSRPDKSVIAVTTPYGRRVAQTASAPQAVVRIQTPPSGFDWGDAGIGAAGGVAITMLGLGTALAVSQRRPRHTRQTTPLS